MWPGATVFIIGGGPSLAGFDYRSIKDRRVIGVNQAFRLGDWVDVLWFGDNGFYTKNKDDVNDFSGLKVTCYLSIPEQGWPHVKNLGRRRQYGLTRRPDMVGWNQNSGASAINFALHTGAKRVVLLGFDMHGTEDGRHYWHDYYGKRNENWNPYPRHLKGFPAIAADLPKKFPGRGVLNATPDSAIDAFPRVALEDVL